MADAKVRGRYRRLCFSTVFSIGAVVVEHWARRIFMVAVLLTVVVVRIALARTG